MGRRLLGEGVELLLDGLQLAEEVRQLRRVQLHHQPLVAGLVAAAVVGLRGQQGRARQHAARSG
eukprot:scaffold6567_cov251-Prasinococcus_capsulatus_cf.AAC.1